MANDYFEKLDRDLAGGILHLLLLAEIDRGKPIHGYGLIRAMSAATEGALQLKAGTIYPILNDLEELGVVRSHWGAGEAGPARKYYQLTPRGRQALEYGTRQWTRIRSSMDQILNGTKGASR